MAMLWIAILSIWQYQGHILHAWKITIGLFCLYATAKSEIQICSNKHETGLVFSISMENSVDPDKMASEKSQLIRILCFQKWNQQDKG